MTKKIRQRVACWRDEWIWERNKLGPASNANVKAANNVVFFFSKSTMFYIRSQVIQPPKSTTLSTSLEPCKIFVIIHRLDKFNRFVVYNSLFMIEFSSRNTTVLSIEDANYRLVFKVACRWYQLIRGE